ncbi:AraC family transcriptional regulator [Amycolatopsis sp. OK19-0408]|uniref:AraC family transcriptional regulator n=1 Tax=Amycolatopsis iheyensis TaxID=2945988 RepID=A0A9X2NLX8_9PSEU|nr:AraC family transcriptional regulator [Amycolatopsis iheyensis]MCR6489079.1 AraC family transcriptional regulator [Amycolatopsis iheyensis]
MGVALWDVARPAGPGRLAGATMAGFRDRGVTPAGLRLVPPPAITLALVFGAGTVAVADASGRQHRGSIVAGLGFGASRVRQAAGFECVQVRLSPVVAGAVLGIRPGELDGAMVALDDLWGREAGRLGERLSELSSWRQRFSLTDAVLARRAETGPPVDPEVVWAWRRLAGTRGRVRIEHLAAEVGWSRKRLWSRFRVQAGSPPKRVAKLVRFDHAVHRLVAGQDPARVAAEGGYADQSYLHREVREFTGATPAHVAAEPFLAVDDVAWPERS